MKIAFVLFKYFPFGGLQRDFLKIAKKVSVMGHEVVVYVREWNGEKPEEFEIKIVPTRSFTNQGKDCEFFESVKKDLAKNPVDRIVGFNKMPGLDYYYAADDCVATRLKNKNFLVKLLPRYKKRINYEKAIFSKKSKTKVLVLTEAQKLNYQEAYGTEDSRFTILPAGAPNLTLTPDEKLPERQRVREKEGINKDTIWLLQVGSNYKLKGVDRTIRAVAALPLNLRNFVELFVIGQDKADKFVKLAVKLGIQKNVTFFKGRSDVLALMNGADLLIHPSKHESAGLVIVESLTRGLPSIVTDTCGYCYHVRNSGAGIVVPSPFEQEKLNEALRKLLDDKNLLNTLSNKARAYSETQDIYSLHETAAKIITGEKC